MMPAEVECEVASQLSGAGTRASARDIEVLCESDFSDLLGQITLQGLLKCACDGGGDLCRHIGTPPGRACPTGCATSGVAAANSPPADPLAALDGL